MADPETLEEVGARTMKFIILFMIIFYSTKGNGPLHPPHPHPIALVRIRIYAYNCWTEYLCKPMDLTYLLAYYQTLTSERHVY